MTTARTLHLFVFGVGVLILSAFAEAYPEMVTHGYVHCTACHTSVVGGHTLTAYGRTLSRELLSQPTLGGAAVREGDEEFLHGLVKPPEWLELGGDIRLLQMFYESERASRARFMVMQAELDTIANWTDRLRAFFSFGRWESKEEQATALDFLYFPRYGLEVQLSPTGQEERWTLRAGRFMPAFGIPFAEHTFSSRQLLEFGPGQERVAAEIAFMNDRWSVVATALGGQANGQKIVSEVGGVLQVAAGVFERSKIGFNYYQSRKDSASGNPIDKKVFGAFAYLGLDNHWYALVEVDRMLSASGKWGVIEIVKLGHEFHQGLQAFGVQEYANPDVGQGDPKFEAYSLGGQWFPRPHFDLMGLLRRERNTALDGRFANVAWLIGHYYF